MFGYDAVYFVSKRDRRRETCDFFFTEDGRIIVLFSFFIQNKTKQLA